MTKIEELRSKLAELERLEQPAVITIAEKAQIEERFSLLANYLGYYKSDSYYGHFEERFSLIDTIISRLDALEARAKDGDHHD